MWQPPQSPGILRRVSFRFILDYDNMLESGTRNGKSKALVLLKAMSTLRLLSISHNPYCKIRVENINFLSILSRIDCCYCYRKCSVYRYYSEHAVHMCDHLSLCVCLCLPVYVYHIFEQNFLIYFQQFKFLMQFIKIEI